MDEPVKVKCPRCDETVRCYLTNDKKLLFKFGLAKVWCPKCKQELTERTEIVESFGTLLISSLLGKALVLIFLTLIFAIVMFIL